MNKKTIDQVKALFANKNIWIHGYHPLSELLAELVILLQGRVFASDKLADSWNAMKVKYPNRISTFQLDRSIQHQQKQCLNHLTNSQIELCYIFDLELATEPENKTWSDYACNLTTLANRLELLDFIKEHDSSCQLILLTQSTDSMTQEIEATQQNFVQKLRDEAQFFDFRISEKMAQLSSKSITQIILKLIMSLLHKKSYYHEQKFRPSKFFKRKASVQKAKKDSPEQLDMSHNEIWSELKKGLTSEDKPVQKGFDNPFTDNDFPSMTNIPQQEKKNVDHNYVNKEETTHSPRLNQTNDQPTFIMLVQDPYFPSTYWNLVKDHFPLDSSMVHTYESTLPLTDIDSWCQSFTEEIAEQIDSLQLDPSSNLHLVLHGWSCIPVIKNLGHLQPHISSLSLLSPLGLGKEKLSPFEKQSFLGRYLGAAGRKLSLKALTKDMKSCPEDQMKSIFSNFSADSMHKHRKVVHALNGLKTSFQDLDPLPQMPKLLSLGLSSHRYNEKYQQELENWDPRIRSIEMTGYGHHMPLDHSHAIASMLLEFCRDAEDSKKIPA